MTEAGSRRASSAPPAPDRSGVLLDTHVFVWLMQGSERLGPHARAAIEAACRGPAGVMVAAISIWEIAMLVSKGRLALDRDVGDWVQTALALPGMGLVDLEPAIAIASSRLPGQMHGDPADRLIVASARHRGAILITEDRSILEYGAEGHIHTVRAGS